MDDKEGWRERAKDICADMRRDNDDDLIYSFIVVRFWDYVCLVQIRYFLTFVELCMPFLQKQNVINMKGRLY